MTRTLALAALVAALAAPSYAQDASLAKIQGPVFVRAAGAKQEAPAKAGQSLAYGDSVKTGAGAVAHVVLGERGAVLVRENSSFTLEGTPQKTTLNFKIGEFLIGLRKRLEKGQSFRVKTRAAVAAVRGTLFWGKSDEKGTSTYAGFGHTVAITAKGKTVVLGPGQKVEIPLGQPPSTPAPSGIPLSYANNFAIGGDLQDLGSLAEPAAKK